MNTGLKNNSHVFYESPLQVDGRKPWMEAHLGHAEINLIMKYSQDTAQHAGPVCLKLAVLAHTPYMTGGCEWKQTFLPVTMLTS